MTLDKVKPEQLRLFDSRHVCDRCVEAMKQQYGYQCCPLGYNPWIHHPNPEEALCLLEKNGKERE